jgi:hypothetical protein
MFNIKIVWFIIMHDVQQKLSNFHGILDIAFYYLVSYIICFFFLILFFFPIMEKLYL